LISLYNFKILLKNIEIEISLHWSCQNEKKNKSGANVS
jgi:hypothetical protein